MRSLTGQGIPNIEAATPEYPYGKYKNKTSALTNNGTELSERTMGDTFQGLQNVVTRTGATPNEQPETALNSQIADAVELLKPVAVAVVGSDDGETFKVLASKVRDPAITFGTSYSANTENLWFLSANFHIKRNGSVDNSHNYIVVANPAYDFPNSSLLTLVTTPKVNVAHSPYFNNMNIYIDGKSNLFFIYPENIAPSDALALARAVLTIYDAGPVA